MALALGLGADLQHGLARGVDPELGRVEHLDADDVVLPGVAGAERLGHRRDADTEQAALLAGSLLALQEAVVVDLLQRQVQALVVVAGVQQEPEGGAVRELTDEVDPAELGLVHAELVGTGLHEPLLEEHRLGDPERAPVGDTPGRLVGVVPLGGQVAVRDVVAAEDRVEQADLELGRLGVGEEAAVVGVGVDPDGLDLAVLADGGVAVEVDVPGVPGGDQVAGLVLDPLHRAGEQDRAQDGDDVAGVHRHLVAEAAAQVGGDDPDHVLGELGHQGDGGADDVRRLGGQVDRQLAGGGVVVADDRHVLDRARVGAGVVDVLRDDLQAGVGEHPLGVLLVTHLPGVADVVGLAVLVVPDDRGAGGQRLLGVDDRRQRVVLDDDRLDGVLGDVGVVGDDAGDLLALETDLVGRQHGLGVVRQGGHPRQVVLGGHLTGDHQVHPWGHPRL